jgi:hypothetical protein
MSDDFIAAVPCVQRSGCSARMHGHQRQLRVKAPGRANSLHKLCFCIAGKGQPEQAVDRGMIGALFGADIRH